MKLVILLLSFALIASIAFAVTPDQNCELNPTQPCAPGCVCVPLAVDPEEIECVKDVKGNPNQSISCDNPQNKCFPQVAGQHQACVAIKGKSVCREVCSKDLYRAKKN